MEFDFGLAHARQTPRPAALGEGFPTELMHGVAEVVRLATDSGMNGRARLVEIVFQHEPTIGSAVAFRHVLVAGHHHRLTSRLFHLPSCPNSRRHL
jgi:hypothetical protein